MKFFKYLSVVLILMTLLINISCNSADKYVTEGLSLDREGKYDEAIEAYNKAIELEPDSTDAWYNKGLTFAKQDNHEEAVKCFDKVLEKDNENASVWYNKGNALYYQFKYEEAIKCYDRALELKPDYNLAKTYKEEAVKAMAEASSGSTPSGGGGVNPFNTGTYINRANDTVDSVNSQQNAPF